MKLVDTNVLIYATRRDSEQHEEYRDLVQAMIDGPEPYAVSDLAVTGMVRVITDRRIFKDTATPLGEALQFATALREQPHAIVVNPGGRFWSIFTGLCTQVGVSGKLVPDALLAALALEHGCEVISADRDFDRFPGLRWRHPLN